MSELHQSLVWSCKDFFISNSCTISTKSFSWFSMVSLHVFVQVVSIERFKVTLIAIVWLFITMCAPYVPSQTTCRLVKPITLIAFVKHLSTVCNHVISQITKPCGCKITLTALVGFFACVCLHVLLNIVCVNSCKVTLVALHWFEATVFHHVLLQMVWINGCITAIVALSNQLPMVCLDMII